MSVDLKIPVGGGGSVRASQYEINTGYNTSKDFVANKFEDAQYYAQNSWELVQEFLEKLADYSEYKTEPSEAEVSIPDAPLSVDAGSVPTAPEVSFDLPTLPTAPGFADTDLSTVDFPSYNLNPPELADIASPTFEMPADPGEGPAISEITVPTSPDFSFPDAPVLSEISIPSAPDNLTMPTFEGTKPDASILVLPENLFDFEENEYSSTLLSLLREQYEEHVLNGGTGLNADVEDGIYQRARTRLDEELANEQEEVENFYADRGFAIPPGVVFAQLDRVNKKMANRIDDLNYKIAEDQARLAYNATQFFLQNGTAFEQMIITYKNAISTRALETQKIIQGNAIELFNAKVNKFNVTTAAWQVAAQVYKAQIESQLILLEEYKTKMEAAKVEAEVQGLQVEVYQALLGAIQSRVQVYRTQMEAAAIQANVEQSKLNVFRSRIEAYSARVQAEAYKFDAYAKRVDAESSKVQLFTEQVRAFGFQVEAKKAEQEGYNQVALVELQQKQFDVALYQAELAGYEAQVNGLVQQSGVDIQEYTATIQGYGAKVSALISKYGADITKYGAQVDASIKTADITLKNAELKAGDILGKRELDLEIAKSGGTVASQLAASALSSVSASTMFGFSGSSNAALNVGESINYGISNSVSESESESHVYTSSE